ncbi:MAG: hypothetical protein WBF58_22810 [Xanthobacteraceae bacterium]
MGLAEIAVLCDAAGIRIKAPEPDDDRALSAVESVRARWWCRGPADAAHLAASAARMARRESNGVPGSGKEAAAIARAEAAVLAAAEKLNIALYSEQDITDGAMTIVARVNVELQQQYAAGELKSVNASYRRYRLETSGRGERVLRYDEWMRKYKENLVREIGATLRQI